MTFRIAAAIAGLALLAADTATAQRVTLRMQPRLGDTIHLRLDQQLEMRGAPHDSTGGPTTSSTLRVRARVIPVSVRGGVTTMTAITDSLVVGPAAGAPKFLQSAQRALTGRSVLVRVLADGAMELAEPGADAAALIGSMPALLPPRPVRVGEEWMREMRLPLRGGRDRGSSVRATFRLDSLSRDGGIAFISVRGTFYTPATAPRSERELSGNVDGSIEFNRALGWITSSRTSVTARSHVTSSDPRRPDVDVWMRVTQRLTASIVR